MDSARINGMRALAHNLRSEGQKSRAALVDELCDAVNSASVLLFEVVNECEHGTSIISETLRERIRDELGGRA